MKRKIEIPKTCPSCNYDLEQVNSQLFCRNSECSAQSTKKVEAFVKKIGIKGLGPKSISKLGFVKPLEIYEMPQDEYEDILGAKIGMKISDEVENSTYTDFATFLAALSIPLIGDTAAKKIATVVYKLSDLDDVVELPIGEKATFNLFEWWENNREEAELLEQHFRFEKIIEVTNRNKGTVCITGKLNDFSNRTKAKQFLESKGYKVTNSVSSLTDYLVAEEGRQSSKLKKAESLGIPIVTIKELITEEI